ncbi:MAG: hypothetical protein JNL96_23350 [Planctomycetaceae bacterium]|nr:hypothetical protein [Planctomycetaceae bacterium]
MSSENQNNAGLPEEEVDLSTQNVGADEDGVVDDYGSANPPSVALKPSPHDDDEYIGPSVQDSNDVSIAGIAWFLAVMVVSLVVTMAVIYGQYQWLSDDIAAERPLPTLRAGERSPPPAPNLQESPASVMAKMRVEQEAALQEFAWADAERKHLHIPIERAMKIVEKSGLPKWPAAAPTGTAAPAAGAATTTSTPAPAATAPSPALTSPAAPTAGQPSVMAGPSLGPSAPTLPKPTATASPTGARP